MIELVSIAVKTILSRLSIKDLRAQNNAKKLQGIGTTIFSIYSGTATIAMNARSIHDELAWGIDWMKEKSNGGEPNREYGTNINIKLQYQSIEVRKVASAILQSGQYLTLLHPDAMNRLLPLLHGKGAALFHLSDILGGHQRGMNHSPCVGPCVPNVDYDVIDSLLDKIEHRDPSVALKFDRHMSHPGLIVCDSMKHLDIDDPGSIPASKYTVIEEYLRRNNIEERCKELEMHAQELRHMIIKNFSVDEILISIKDPRLRLQDAPLISEQYL